MPVMAALPNIGGALCSTLQSLADNTARTRNTLKFAGVPQTRQQPLVGQRSPYYEDTWSDVLLFNTFFWLSLHALVANIQPDKVVGWCRNGDFCVLNFQRAACSTFQTCILNSH